MRRQYDEHRRALRAGATIESVDEAAIYLRDNYECQYCGSREKLTLDHIIPLAKGGKHSEDNLCVACGSCNCSKATKDVILWLIESGRAFWIEKGENRAI